MGASGVITSDGNAADEKAQSAWIAAMKSAAESNDRDPKYAIAMADADVEVPELNKEKGSFLTLTGTDALQVHYAEGIVENSVKLLKVLLFSSAMVDDAVSTFAEDSVVCYISH